MKAEDEVKLVYPDAFARNHALFIFQPQHWVIYDQRDPAMRKPISVQSLATEDEAWADALRRIQAAQKQGRTR